MTFGQFVHKIHSITDCKNCPIQLYCKHSNTISCYQCARDYYMTHGGHRIQWQKIIDSIPEQREIITRL